MTGRVMHSVSRWCYEAIELDALCKAAVRMGIESVELVGPSDFPVLIANGLVCAMATFPVAKGPDGIAVGGIERGFNRTEHHEMLVAAYTRSIDAVADAGFRNLICFSGIRGGLDDKTGMDNCAKGIQSLMPLCEKRGVRLCMELLNSKVDHPDYMCDHTQWGVDLVHRIGSGNFKLLYDIYHMQIMEGDVIATIRKHHSCIAHYHTGGVPGRHEIDASQELNYGAIISAIHETGYDGFIGQEFVPASPNPLASLQQAVNICNV